MCQNILFRFVAILVCCRANERFFVSDVALFSLALFFFFFFFFFFCFFLFVCLFVCVWVRLLWWWWLLFFFSF